MEASNNEIVKKEDGKCQETMQEFKSQKEEEKKYQLYQEHQEKNEGKSESDNIQNKNGNQQSNNSKESLKLQDISQEDLQKITKVEELKHENKQSKTKKNKKDKKEKKESKEQKKESKEANEIKNQKEEEIQNENKESKKNKDKKEKQKKKEVKETKDTKDTKEAKESKESNEKNQIDDQKHLELQENKEQKDLAKGNNKKNKKEKNPKKKKCNDESSIEKDNKYNDKFPVKRQTTVSIKINNNLMDNHDENFQYSLSNEPLKLQSSKSSTNFLEMVKTDLTSDKKNQQMFPFHKVPYLATNNFSHDKNKAIFENFKSFTNYRTCVSVEEFVCFFKINPLSDTNIACIKLLKSFEKLVESYKVTKNKIFHQDLQDYCTKNINYIKECLTLTQGLLNALSYIQNVVRKVPFEANEEKAKKWLIQTFEDFIELKIIYQREAIKDSVLKASLLKEGDTILTFECGLLLEEIINNTKVENFKLIITGGEITNETKMTISRMEKAGIKVEYCHVLTLQYMMREVTKIVIQAVTVLSNGTIIGRLGTAQMSSIAKYFNKSVIVLCESYKLSEEVVLESIPILSNFLGDPRELLEHSQLINEKSPILLAYNPLYDVTPSEYIDLIITDAGWLPPTSVLPLIKEIIKHDEKLKYYE